MEISATPPVGAPSSSIARLRAAAVEVEAVFLAEMLKSAGLGKSRQSLGGGAGEDQFASLLVQQQAHQLARSGGVGLSEILFKSMMEQESANTAK